LGSHDHTDDRDLFRACAAPAAVVAPGGAVGAGVPRVPPVPLDAARKRVVGVQQQRLVALGHDRERRGHVGLRHVVVLDVVAGEVGEAEPRFEVGPGTAVPVLPDEGRPPVLPPGYLAILLGAGLNTPPKIEKTGWFPREGAADLS